MPAEFDLYGIYVPVLLVLAFAALVVSLVLRRLLAWTGFYSLVWHRALFDLAIYVVLLGAADALLRWTMS